MKKKKKKKKKNFRRRILEEEEDQKKRDPKKKFKKKREKKSKKFSSQKMRKQQSGGGGGAVVKVVGQIDVEIDEAKKKKRWSSSTHKPAVLSVRLTNQNYDRAAEICVDFCERHGLPTKIAGPLAIRLRNAYGEALMQRTTTMMIPDDDDDDDNDALDGEDEGDAKNEERNIVATKTEETKQQRRATTPVVVQLPSDPAEMARRVAEMKKSHRRQSEGETSQAFRMVTPSRVGSWNPIANGEVTMEKNGTDSARVVRIEQKEKEEEEEEENGELVEVVVEEHRQQETQQPSKYSALEEEEEESEAEEEMLEFEITPTKQDYAESFARPPDWFVEDIEGKTRNDASTSRENKTPSKKENGAPEDDDDSDDNSLSEKIIQASPGFKDSLKMFEALSPKKKSSDFAKSPTMTAPGFVSPMETKPKRYVPRDLNE